MFSILISTVVLILAGILLARLLYKNPIERQKLAIEETDLPECKTELIHKSQTGNDFVIGRFERMLSAIKTASGGKEPEIDYDQHNKAQLIFRLVWVGIALDWLMQWLVNQRMSILSSLAWVAPSLLLALLISWFTELAAFALTSDPARKARGERICRDAVIITGIVSVSCILLFLYGRTVSAALVSDWLIVVISGSLWLAAEGLGIACGFAAAWGRHVDRDGRATDRYHQIEEKLQTFYEFRDWLKDQEDRSRAKIVTVFLLAFLILVPSLRNSVYAGSGSELVILIDGTASVDQIRLSEALMKLRESVPVLVRKYSRIQIGTFSNEGPFTKMDTDISIPVPASVRDCSELATKSIRQDLTAIFPGIKEYEDGKNAEQCQAARLSIEKKNEGNLKLVIEQIRSAMPVPIQSKSGCTAVSTLLQSLLSFRAKLGSTILLITDGEETCNQDPFPVIRIPTGTQVIMFLVPRAGSIEKEGLDAIKRGKFWRTEIPGLIAIPYTDMLSAMPCLPK